MQYMYLIHTIKPQYLKTKQRKIKENTVDTKKTTVVIYIQCVILIHVLHPWYCIHLNFTCG